jgi:hypothetical protein
MQELEITVGEGTLEDGSPAKTIKIQTDTYELNVWIPFDQIELLAMVPSTSWEAGALKIGKAASSDVFWATENDVVSILIGHDDETWDVGIFLPMASFRDVLEKIERNA